MRSGVGARGRLPPRIRHARRQRHGQQLTSRYRTCGRARPTPVFAAARRVPHQQSRTPLTPTWGHDAPGRRRARGLRAMAAEMILSIVSSPRGGASYFAAEPLPKPREHATSISPTSRRPAGILDTADDAWRWAGRPTPAPRAQARRHFGRHAMPRPAAMAPALSILAGPFLRHTGRRWSIVIVEYRHRRRYHFDCRAAAGKLLAVTTPCHFASISLLIS